MKTYKLNEPMSWKDFKYMPADLRLNYLRKLIAAYDVGGKELAEMFGVAPNSLSAYCIKQFPGEPIFSRSHQTLRGAGRDKWDAFIAGETYADEAQTPAPAQEAQTQAPTPAPKPEAQTSAPATAYRPETMIQGSVLLQGEANDILKAIRALLADGKAYRVQLGFEMQAEEKGAQQPIED